MTLGTLDTKTPIGKIIEHIQRNGSCTIKDLELVLGVTTTAVRQHLSNLQTEGYVERRQVNTGVGRPHYAYFATERVQELLGCHCDDLALTLLEEVFQLEGMERAGMLLDRVSDRLASKYAQSVRSSVLQERVDELAGALNARGVLTDVTTENDQLVLRTYNCPFHELAQEHDEVCVMDKSMMEKALGSKLHLNSRIMDGNQCCSFVVADKKPK